MDLDDGEQAVVVNRADTTTMRRQPAVLMALLCAAAVTAVAFLGAAEAKKKPGIAGKYTGLTEYDGTVSFKLTRAGKVLDFTLTNATMYCQVEVPPGDPEPPEYTKVVTITHGPMPMEKKSKKNPQGKRFEVSDPAPGATAARSGYFKGGIVGLTSTPEGGRVLDEMGFNGETSFETTNGPYNVPGTERCVTKLIDWEAKPPGSKGFVAVGNSGHLRPPLSEF